VVEILGKLSQGTHLDDRRTTFADYLDRRLRWWESEAELKPSTLDSYREAIELYFKPGLRHVRLVDLRDHHFRDLYAALRLINRPEQDGDRGDLLRRLLQARATRDGKKISTRQLSDARIKRIHAVGLSALSDAVPHTLPFNPAASVKPGGRRGTRKVRPLLWTAPRVEQWQKSGEVPATVMVWSAAQCGAFLDHAADERLYSLYHLAAYYGLRRSELAGLAWADVVLAAPRVHIRRAQVDDRLDSTKSQESERQIVIDENTASVLKAWRKTQLEERVACGSAWTDTGRVFTREDGTPLRPGWISTRFAALAAEAGQPPVRFHDLRHGTATVLLAARQPVKVISEILGHSTSAFTADVYTEVAEELADSAASAIAAFVPRRSLSAPGGTIIGPSGGRDDR
jgi:integrase